MNQMMDDNPKECPKKWNSDDYITQTDHWPIKDILVTLSHSSLKLVPSTPKDNGFMDGVPCFKWP
jgi:hypothetical protein